MGKMTATVANLKQPAPLRAQLHCSKCGITIDAACDCGVDYVPAGVAAAKAIEANPDKNNQAIADMIGVAESTVREIRKGVSRNRETDKRIGKDGKSYPATKKQPAHKSARIPVEQQYMARVEQAKALAVPYTGKITDHVIELARSVAEAWTEFADKLWMDLKHPRH